MSTVAESTKEITERSVRAHLEFLASDAMNGRGSGTRDEWIAAEYIGAQLRLWGLEPLGDGGGYVTLVEIERSQLASPPTLASGAARFTHGKEILVQSMSAPRIAAPLRRYKEGEAVAGAAVLLPEGTTPAAGALAGAAMLLAPETTQARNQWTFAASRPVTLGTRLVAVPAPSTQAPARVVLDRTARAALDALPDGTTITLEGEPAPAQKTQTWNVVARLRGRDDDRAREAILLSAHLDHIGNRPPRGGAAPGADTINNGADDDASGCVAVLELAKVLAAKKRTRRTILFAFFGSEESGGYGSRQFSGAPPVPLERIVANLQFEMIGRPDRAVAPQTLWLTGFERSTLGPELARRGARLVQDPHPDENFFFRSDNISLARRGVVAHTVSSYGLHREYHTPEDETRLVDYRHMTSAIRSMVKPIEWLANSTFRPAWLPGKKP